MYKANNPLYHTEAIKSLITFSFSSHHMILPFILTKKTKKSTQKAVPFPRFFCVHEILMQSTKMR